MTSAVGLLILVAAAAYVGLLVVAWRFGDRLILPAPASSYRLGAIEEFGTIRTADGVALAAVHLPNDDARYTILYSHGNAEDLGNLLPVLELLHGLGFGVFAYDYRGYGASEGRPSVEGVLRDAEAAYAHVAETLGVPDDRLILWGRSVGGGPTVHLASQHAVAGMVLEATFTSAFCVVTRRPILPFDRLKNLKLMRALQVPLLIIHGRQDLVVPFVHGRRLYECAAKPKRSVWVDEAGHNDLWLVARERLVRELLDFAASLNGSSAERSGSRPHRSPPAPSRRQSA